MTYLEGQTLKCRIDGNALATDELLDVAIQITGALDAAHSKGIIHRDIKPANIFITARGEVKILDFGLAKLAGDKEVGVNAVDLTGTGVALGTAAYMSPEQARGETLDTRTDVFSFGAVLYEMATGQQAFRGATAAIIHDAILNQDPPPPSRLHPALPARIDEIIGGALQKDRDLRCQSAAVMRADLITLKRDMDSGRLASAEVRGSRAIQRETPPTKKRRGTPLALGRRAGTGLDRDRHCLVRVAFRERPARADRTAADAELWRTDPRGGDFSGRQFASRLCG